MEERYKDVNNSAKQKNSIKNIKSTVSSCGH